MADFENKQGITRIALEREIQAFCPLGNDFYTARIEVVFAPGERIMDYCEADKYILGLSGEVLIIEDLVKKVFDYFVDYADGKLEVTAHAKSNTHFPVSVTKAL